MKNIDNWIEYNEKKKSKKNPELKKACWPGYEAIGLKKKNNRMVPNCVPKK